MVNALQAPPTPSQPHAEFFSFVLSSLCFCVGEGRKSNQRVVALTSQEAALCQWLTSVGGGAWNHSSSPTSHSNRDELSSQKPLKLLIKALYIFCDVFFPVFTPSFDKISLLLLYYFSTGVHHHFHASIIPSNCLFSVFFPTDFLCQTEIQLFLYFYFLW